MQHHGLTSAWIGSSLTKWGIASTKRVSVELNSSYVTVLKSPIITKCKLYTPVYMLFHSNNTKKKQ